MKHFNVRQTLIARTIDVVASEGLDKTTTKAIVGDTGINEAYIYKYFRDKDDLLATTFSALDQEFFDEVIKDISAMYLPDVDFKGKCHRIFTKVWQFMLGNPAKCITFIRYFASPYFLKYSAKEHKARYEPLVEKTSVALRDGANTWMILHHILETMFIFATRVFNGELENNEDTSENVFVLVYGTVMAYRPEEHSITH